MSDEPKIGTESGANQAEATLRLLAKLPPPQDLTARVHAHIQARIHERMAEEPSRRRGFWSYWMPAQRLQFAAAAALAVAVAASTWSVYHRRPQPKSGSPAAIQPAESGPASAGFGAAKAARVPSALHPIKVPPAPRKKPAASHAATKPTAKPDSGGADSAAPHSPNR